ncbi:hypothetical protein [Oecophyllibacter saccharovorans]|uniref:Uncharacterized protein n=1 Tax=Oecophyllibacter saccharovorans TaxID=2558360 RepID=A0A506UKK8_9PROT|nr:hypothetical protein [Oecophyllibacter saccharovorans]TPW33877.1 hypothetical protein E3202_04610 [Oecophyllibacter saccharovorans]
MSEQIFELVGYGAEIRAFGSQLGKWGRAGSDLYAVLQTPFTPLNEAHSALLDLLKVAYNDGLGDNLLKRYKALVQDFTFDRFEEFSTRLEKATPFFNKWVQGVRFYKTLFAQGVDKIEVTPAQAEELAQLHQYLEANIYLVLPSLF